MEKTYALKPRGYGEIIDLTVRLYKDNFKLVAGIAAIIYIPFALLSGLAALVETQFQAQMVNGVLGLIQGFLGFFVTGALIIGISNGYLGYKVTIKECYDEIISRFWPFFLTMLYGGLLVFFGLILCLIPGIIFSFWVVFLSEVFIIENRKTGEALKRSRELISGQVLRVFVISFLVGLIVFAAAVLLAGIPSFLTAYLPEALAPIARFAVVLWTGIVNSVLIPIQMIASIILYYDIRIRKENFDLQMMSERLGKTGTDSDINN